MSETFPSDSDMEFDYSDLLGDADFSNDDLMPPYPKTQQKILPSSLQNVSKPLSKPGLESSRGPALLPPLKNHIEVEHGRFSELKSDGTANDKWKNVYYSDRREVEAKPSNQDIDTRTLPPTLDPNIYSTAPKASTDKCDAYETPIIHGLGQKSDDLVFVRENTATQRYLLSSIIGKPPRGRYAAGFQAAGPSAAVNRSANEIKPREHEKRLIYQAALQGANQGVVIEKNSTESHTSANESDRSNNPDQNSSLHQSCPVCEKLKNVRVLNNGSGETATASDSQKSSVSSMVSEEPLKQPPAPIPRLCKQCGTGENDQMRFLICGNAHCFYKYYHIRCLKSSQVARQQHQRQHCWHCPSCLCKTCLGHRDDEKIVLCNGCHEGYHTNCMKPPRTTLPEGKWYCISCNAVRARQGMQRYEKWVLQQHGQENIKLASGTDGMDVLVNAAQKLSSEEGLAAAK